MSYEEPKKMGTDVLVDGLHFESITEGQWYSYFKEAGMEPRPQPDSFSLENGAIYTPDFFLPAQDTYVEVKNGNLDDVAIEKCKLLAVATQKAVLLLDGEPNAPEAKITLIGTSPADKNVNIHCRTFRMGEIKESWFFRGRYAFSKNVDPTLIQQTEAKRRASRDEAFLKEFNGDGENDLSTALDDFLKKFSLEQ